MNKSLGWETEKNKCFLIIVDRSLFIHRLFSLLESIWCESVGTGSKQCLSNDSQTQFSLATQDSKKHWLSQWVLVSIYSEFNHSRSSGHRGHRWKAAHLFLFCYVYVRMYFWTEMLLWATLWRLCAARRRLNRVTRVKLGRCASFWDGSRDFLAGAFISMMGSEWSTPLAPLIASRLVVYLFSAQLPGCNQDQ